MEYKYLDNFVRSYLDHNLGGSDEEIQEKITDQLSVEVYKLGLESELGKAFTDLQFSWLSFFKKVWKEPESNNLYTEKDARNFAVIYIWNEVFPNTPSP